MAAANQDQERCPNKPSPVVRNVSDGEREPNVNARRPAVPLRYARQLMVYNRLKSASPNRIR